MSTHIYYKLSYDMYDLIAQFIKDNPGCSMLKIQKFIYEKWKEKSKELPDDFYEIVRWKKSSPYSYIVEDILSLFIIRGRIKQTALGGYKISKYGERKLEEKSLTVC